MEVLNLGAADQLAFDATHLVKVKYTDLTAAATTQTLALLSLRAGHMVKSVYARVKTAFAGPSISAATVQVGDGSDTDRNLAAGSVFAAGYLSIQPATTGPSTFAAADTLDALFTATGANWSVGTAGEVWFFIRIVDLAAPEGVRD